MKITVTDFSPIAEASIALDGLTVIAGENDTGKSTVGRLLFAFLKSINRGQTKKSSHALLNMLLQMFGSDSRGGSVEFESNGKKEKVQISLSEGSVIIDPVKIDRVFGDQKTDTLLIETPLVWQLFDTFQGIAAQTYQKVTTTTTTTTTAYDDEYSYISAPYSHFDVYLRLNGSVKPRQVNVNGYLDAIEKTVNGRIAFKNNNPVFERGEDSFPMESVATGIQSFGFMQRILELGLARPGMYLILDEPEVHLHPKWQLEYARLLVKIVKELGVTILLTTHSAVFVETLEFVGKKKLGDKCKFYLSERGDAQAVVMRDVSDNLEPIYEKLAHPLMQLSLFQGDA